MISAAEVTLTSRKVADRVEAVQLLHDAAASGLPRVYGARLHGINARPLPPLRLVELVPRSNPPTTSGVRVRCGVRVVEVDPSFEYHVLAVVARC